jgi:subtilisin family serine protease
MGAQKLWSQGLTGKGVKIGVIDSGIELHREFEGVVKERRDVTGTGGTTPGKTHATHVAGTIHALAPEAEIRSYKVFDPNDGGMAKDAGVLRAIDDAVADGNNVINLSLGGPADAFKREKRRLLSRINKYSRQGVIFVIASGNGRAYGDEGVTSPSVAREAVSAGALDIADRMTDFTQYGPTYDATTGKKSIKRIFLTPGKHVVSSVGKKDYQGMSGTSMAAPHLTGSFGLLVGGLLEMGGLMSPRAVARAVKEAVVVSARPLKERPADAGDREEFVIVDPTMAYARLTASRPR